MSPEIDNNSITPKGDSVLTSGNLSQGTDFTYTRKDSTYEGDLVDRTATPIKSQYQKLDFADPAELLLFFDKQYTEESPDKPTLHKWQTELLESLAAAKPTSQHPYKFCLVAANGSGKDSVIASSFAVWFTLCKIQSRVIITSSSGTQLTSQTEPAIRRLCEFVNAFFGMEYFRIRQRYIVCRLTGSEIRMFATDEAGKAEGYHPIKPGAEMAILVNEGKSVSEEIHNALRRCTGFNYWLEYSSPGEPVGFFYRAFTTWKHTLRVTSYDCPHLSREEIEDDKRDLGEHSALFRSKHLALFTSLGGQVIITNELVDKIRVAPPTYTISGWVKRIGIDLAAGGDENSICYTLGNKCLKETCFREVDTTITADRIERDLLDNNVPKNHEHIYADDGGIGHAIIDTLVRRGWNIKRIMNQWAASNRRQYGNRGAENWYRVKRILEEILFDVTTLTPKTIEQLTTRHYKQGSSGARIFLESKKEAKANGRPSPDRADAFILSLTGLTVDDFLKAKTVDIKPRGHKDGEQSFTNIEDTKRYYEDSITYGQFEGKNVQELNRFNGKRINGSLAVAMNRTIKKVIDI